MTKTYTLEEQKENRKKWVKALRSGKYDQGRSYLKRSDKYCCLGVACEVAGLIGEPSNKNPQIIYFDNEKAFLPTSVMSFLGLSSDYGRYDTGYSHEISLAGQNDKGLTFKEIADIIEAEPEGLIEY